MYPLRFSPYKLKGEKGESEEAYFETHLPYSDDPNEIKFKHKSEREAAEGKGKPKQKKSLTWASSDELEQRKIYVPDPNDWLIKYEDKSAGMDVDDDSDASVEAALKRKAREEESERNAAAKARKRKMEQMRATTSWKIPERYTLAILNSTLPAVKIRASCTESQVLLQERKQWCIRTEKRFQIRPLRLQKRSRTKTRY